MSEVARTEYNIPATIFSTMTGIKEEKKHPIMTPNFFLAYLAPLRRIHLNLGCGPLHAWEVRVLFRMWEKHELIVFSHMHECIQTYDSLTCSYLK